MSAHAIRSSHRNSRRVNFIDAHSFVLSLFFTMVIVNKPKKVTKDELGIFEEQLILASKSSKENRKTMTNTTLLLFTILSHVFKMLTDTSFLCTEI